MASTTKRSLRIRDLGYHPGDYPTGPSNSILDIPGLHVSQLTVPTTSSLPCNSTATKGLTVISPRPPSRFTDPCAAATFTFNGNGALTGSQQIEDWGFINTPLALTNSLSVGLVYDGIWDWILDQQDAAGFESQQRGRNYGTPVVAETCDWLVNRDVGASRLSREDVASCFADLKARGDPGAEVREGQEGGGAGMTCHEFAGGTGTASRIIGGGDGSRREEGYVLAALCQSNYGLLPELNIGGVPVGRILQKEKAVNAGAATGAGKEDGGRPSDGSIVIYLFTNAPLATHQLHRLARHATVGLARVGAYGVGRTHSGDIFVAVSTAERGGSELLTGIPYRRYGPTQTNTNEVLKNESIDTYFYACAEVVEEAVLNSIVAASQGTVGMDGTVVPGLPLERVKEILAQHLVRV